MNREIKFRAWLKDEKRMVSVVDLKFLTDHYGNKKEIVYWDENINSANYAYFEDIELMQYTGLKDKNGTKIFEGDIVIFINDTRNKKYTIKFDEEDCSFSIFLNRIYYHLLKSECNDIKIIGNIYENEELLEYE